MCILKKGVLKNITSKYTAHIRIPEVNNMNAVKDKSANFFMFFLHHSFYVS